MTEQPLERLRIICETPSQYPATLLKNTLDNLESGAGAGGAGGGVEVEVAGKEGGKGEFVD